MPRIRIQKSRIFIASPVVAFQRRIEGFSVTLRACIIGSPRDVASDDRPLGPMCPVQGKEELILFRRPSRFLHIGRQGMQPTLRAYCKHILRL